MFARYLQQHTFKRLDKLFPDNQLLFTGKSVSYLSVDVEQNKDFWVHNPQPSSQQHKISSILLQICFKNHILDYQGFLRMNRLIQEMGSQSDQFSKSFFAKDKKQNLKSIFIMGNFNLESINKLTQTRIMKQPYITKILCFDKAKPFQYTKSFQRLCIENNIRAFPLSNFTPKALIKQVGKHSKMTALIHQTIMNQHSFLLPSSDDKNIESKIRYENTPENIIMLSNHTKIHKPSQEFITLSQLIRNYPIRTYKSKTEDPNFSIKRFQRIDQIFKYKKAIQREEGIIQDDDDDDQ